MTYEEALTALPPGKYRHFKGRNYELLGVARHSETEEPMAVYRPLYGEGALWVRPAAMWNETLERDGKIYRRFYPLERVERVERCEALFDRACADRDPEALAELETYLSSGLWLQDYEADERGELPPDLKRGVLAQDALCDLLAGEE